MTKDRRVIVEADFVVVVMDTDGTHLTRYEKDDDNEPLFRRIITYITSTNDGNIFVAGDNKVVVFGKTEIINIYRENCTVNYSWKRRFYPPSVTTTPIDNVIVVDMEIHTLHILNNSSYLLTNYNTTDIEIYLPEQLAITTEGSFNVLYMHCVNSSTRFYKMVITGC